MSRYNNNRIPRRGKENSPEKNQKKGVEKQKEVEQINEELMNYAYSEWGRYWVQSILHFGRPYRMRRALAYAKEERISNLILSPGKIFASVQGTAPTPYRVNIHFDIILEEGWQKILKEIGKTSLYIIQLLDNKLPEDFINIFKEKGYSLFPKATKKLNATCNCPDQEVPCKHIACTILYIARVVDFDPFLLLKLKGKNREEFLQELKRLRNISSELLNTGKGQNNKLKKSETEKSKDFNVPLLPIHDIDISEENFEEGKKYNIGFHLRKPRKNLEALDSLGNPDNLEDPATFDLLFRTIYYKVVKKTYSMAKSLEKE